MFLTLNFHKILCTRENFRFPAVEEIGFLREDLKNSLGDVIFNSSTVSALLIISGSAALLNVCDCDVTATAPTKTTIRGSKTFTHAQAQIRIFGQQPFRNSMVLS